MLQKGPMQEITQRVRQTCRASIGPPRGCRSLLVDAEGTRDVASSAGCAVCARIVRSPKRDALCREHRRTAIEESFRWGEPFISICPLGLVTFAVPSLPGEAALRRSSQRLFDLPADGVGHARRGGRAYSCRHRLHAGSRARAPVSVSAWCPPRASVAARIFSSIWPPRTA